MQTVFVSLDDPPSRRWNTVIGSFRSQLERVKYPYTSHAAFYVTFCAVFLLSSLGHALTAHTTIGKALAISRAECTLQHQDDPFAQTFNNAAQIQEGLKSCVRKKDWGFPYRKEMQSIASQLDWGPELILLYQLAIEHGCSGTVAVVFDSTDTPWHCAITDLRDCAWIRELAVRVFFAREGMTEMVATSFVGYVGVISGMIPSAASVSHHVCEQFDHVFATSVSRALQGVPLPGLGIREALENAVRNGDDVLSLPTSAPRPVCIVSGGVSKKNNCMTTVDQRGIIFSKSTLSAQTECFSLRTHDELRAFNNAIAEFKRFEFDVPRPLLMDLRRLLHKSPMINTGSVMETIMVPAHWVMDGRVMQTVVDDSSDLPVTQLTRKRLLTTSKSRLLLPIHAEQPAVLWVDPRPECSENQHYVYVQVVQARSNIEAKQWIYENRNALVTLHGQALFRVLTNKYRQDDGGELAPASLLDEVKKSGFENVPLLVYTNNITPVVEELVSKCSNVFATTSLREALEFGVMNSLEVSKPTKKKFGIF